MLIDLPKKKIKFCLVGSGKLCVEFARLLLDNGFPSPVIITWSKKQHNRDQILLKNNKNYEDIFIFSEKNDIEIFEVDNINNISSINILKKRNVNIIFSVKSRWIIKDHFINEFNGYVINIHQGNLPKERGSVTYQKIMNNIHIAGVTIHLISPTIDGGKILYNKTKKINEKRPTIDLMNSINMGLSITLLKQLVSDLKARKEIVEHNQDNDQSIYMPQFNTELNGAIDWDWTAEEMDRFIRAFGPPMPGAFTFYKNKKISLLESKVEKTNHRYHPYFNGRIVTIKNDGSMRIITKDDYLIINRIQYKQFDGLPIEIIQMNSNAVLFTPIDILERARIEFTHSLNMPSPHKEK